MAVTAQEKAPARTAPTTHRRSVPVLQRLGLLLVYGLNTWLPQIMISAGYELSASLALLELFILQRVGRTEYEKIVGDFVHDDSAGLSTRTVQARATGFGLTI